MPRIPRPGPASSLGAGALLLAVAALGASAGPAPQPAAPAPDPLAALGWKVSSGAAPGYIEDRRCALCHGDLWRSYQEVGMARSFARPAPDDPAKTIEDLTAPAFYHAPSQRYYEMRAADGTYLFRRYQLDEDGQPIHLVEQPVDWILGSGNHSRTYLFRTPGGELYQLPLAWYSQTASFGMAPGYDRPDHDGLARRVRRECMFCHNAYPDVPEGSDRVGALQTFPEQLPEGTGCQRCHGPGAEHARRALRGGVAREELRAAIVNPGRLDPERRDDVCYECHLQPSVAIAGIRVFGRGDYSFRPGSSLTDYLVPMDVVEKGVPEEERFEINQHPYRLRQSRCFAESGAALNCLTCHDPHRKVPVAERAAHYRSACLGCHDGAQWTGEEGGHPAAATADCVSCHMPQRRTRDVVQVVMTDHLIQRRPRAGLTAPLEEHDPVLTEASLYFPERSPSGQLGRLYGLLAILQAAPSQDGAELVREALEEEPRSEIEPYLMLLRAQLARRLAEQAVGTAQTALVKWPENPLLLEWLALAQSASGHPEEALEPLARAAALSPDRPESHYNLGLLELRRDRVDVAVGHLQRALELRPNLFPAWYYLGAARAHQQQLEAAIAAFRRTLELEPTYLRAYLGLARALAASDDLEGAIRLLRQGHRITGESKLLAEIDRLSAGAE